MLFGPPDTCPDTCTWVTSVMALVDTVTVTPNDVMYVLILDVVIEFTIEAASASSCAVICVEMLIPSDCKRRRRIATIGWTFVISTNLFSTPAAAAIAFANISCFLLVNSANVSWASIISFTTVNVCAPTPIFDCIPIEHDPSSRFCIPREHTQLVDDVLPLVIVLLYTGQSVHCWTPVASAYLPEGHDSQLAYPISENFPATQ